MGEQSGWERKILCEILRKVTKVSFKKDITEVIGGLTSISRRRLVIRNCPDEGWGCNWMVEC